MNTLKINLIAKLLGNTPKTCYQWKKENRYIINFLEKYFTNDDIEEFLTTGKIEKQDDLNKFSKKKYLKNSEKNEKAFFDILTKISSTSFRYNNEGKLENFKSSAIYIFFEIYRAYQYDDTFGDYEKFKDTYTKLAVKYTIGNRNVDVNYLESYTLLFNIDKIYLIFFFFLNLINLEDYYYNYDDELSGYFSEYTNEFKDYDLTLICSRLKNSSLFSFMVQ